jgi:acyl-[acyl-carrier-protein]-phospholipid O-acyltransferase/long-chain-fatty-acid--[acyl-carrier-protein] ligase
LVFAVFAVFAPFTCPESHPLLQHCFIRSARRQPDKLAFIDATTNRRVTYQQALLGSLILARRFKRMEPGRIGIMLPTSSGAALAVIGANMAGLTPVMINYSTGADQNCRYAREQCDFTTIITARPLLEKVGCTPQPTTPRIFSPEWMKRPPPSSTKPKTSLSNP